MLDNLKHYLTKIEYALEARNVTEHIHPPAVKVLLESYSVQAIVTNKPRPTAYGAPDFVVTPYDAGNLATCGPEDVFCYIYAILPSPTYSKQHAESLKTHFPRVPLMSSAPTQTRHRSFAQFGHFVVLT